MISFRKKHYDYDLIAIGSGSGGSVAAHYAQSIGKKVAIFEDDAVGGECPNFACVPTKAMLHAGKTYETVKNSKLYGIEAEDVKLNYHAVKRWKDLVVSRTGASHGKASFEKEGIHLINHRATFISPHEVEAGGKIYSAAKFILATGAKNFVPPITGLEETGYLTSREAIDLTHVPKSIMIFGGGAVGCEFAHFFTAFGSKVTLVNRSERILTKEDPEVSGLVQALFENQGVNVLTNMTVVKVEKKGDKKVVHFHSKDKDYFQEYDEILIAVGKVNNLTFNPEKAGIAVDGKGRMRIDKFMLTSVPHIAAAGDIVGPYQFTHTASYQSYIAGHNLFARNKVPVDYRVVPRCVFLSPEVASVGVSEEDAKEKGIPIKKGIMAIGMLGRANTANDFDGFVKIITDKKGVIIGGSIVAPRAGELIHEVALAIQCRIKAETVANMIHAYPTYSEGVKIACGLVQ